MSDELDHLRQANPVDRHNVEAIVALDREELLELIRDNSVEDATITTITPRNKDRGGRVSFAVAGLAVAAAVAAVIMGRGLNLLPSETVVSDAATEGVDASPTNELPVAESPEERVDLEVIVNDEQPGTTSTVDDDQPTQLTPTDSITDYGCWAGGETLAAAIVMYDNQCSQPRADCDQFGAVWVCSSRPMGDGAPPEWELAEEDSPTVQQPTNQEVFDPTKDLLAIHVASSDVDGEALADIYELINDLGLGERATLNTADSETAALSAWSGAAGTGRVDGEAAAQAAEQWLSIVQAGGIVWIANGDQTSFTSTVEQLAADKDPTVTASIRADIDGNHLTEVLQILGLDPGATP